MAELYDLAILGAGPGGYVAALRAAQLGARVALVEKERVGGTCLNIGCIPTKALTTSTELMLKARRAAEFGLSIPTVQPDLPGLMDYKQSTVDRLVNGVEQLLIKRQVTLVRGQARPEGAEVKAAQFPFSANPRASILRETEGLVKLVCEAGSGRILGVHMMGPHVTELIAEGALAVETSATADDLSWITHAHPTLPEAMLEAALGFRDATIHFHITQV